MDITKFCATTDPRHYLHKPMRHEGYLYAANGHIAVRIADDPAIEAGPMPQNLQNGILQKMADDTEERAWQPVPVIDKANLRDCAYCNGTGARRRARYATEKASSSTSATGTTASAARQQAKLLRSPPTMPLRAPTASVAGKMQANPLRSAARTSPLDTFT